MAVQRSIGSPDTAALGHDAPWPLGLYFLLLLAAAGVVIGIDLLDGVLFAGDVDDVLREMEIRRLVGGAGWFDLSMPSVRMPDVYVLPWSRLVDLPYALITWGLEPAIGQERALALAFRLWPPVLGLFYLSILLGCLRRLEPRASGLPVMLLLAMPAFAIYSIWEFSPGRIDHHNVQIVLLSLLTYGILRWDHIGGVIVGAASSLSLAVGLETLPVLAVALAALSFAWILGGVESGVMLRSTGAACAAGALLLVAVLIPPSRYLAGENDSFSAPYAAAMIGFGFIALISAGRRSETWTRSRRCFLFIGAHLLLLAMIVWAYPGLLDGPMPMLEGLAKVYWFDRIRIEQSIFSLFSPGDILQYLAVFAVMAAAAPAAVRAMVRGEPALPVVFIATATAVIMACISLRFLRITLGLVVILLPAAFHYFREESAYGRGRRLVVGCLTGLSLLAAGRLYLFPPSEVRIDAFDHLVRGDCGTVDASVFRNLRTGRIMTPPRLGIELAHAQPPNGISVSAIPFHRASTAMSDVFAVLMGSTAAEHSELLNRFDYLAFCRIPAGLPNEDDLPLLRDLQAGRHVAGLAPLTDNGAVLIFRIEHGQLN